MGAIACLIAFIAAALAGRRSIGHGLAVLLPVGCIYGYFRIMVLDTFSHFLFDAALFGFYVGVFTTTVTGDEQKASNSAMQWTFVLAGWPIVCMMYSPLLDSQPLLVQFVGLRADAMMIPMLIAGARAKKSDLEIAAPVLAVCCIAALVFGALQYTMGVEAFIPRNTASTSIYIAHDEIGYVRTPSMFTNAHAFGATMVTSMPILAALLESKSGVKRALAIVGIVSGVLGVFVSATRTPVIILAIVAVPIVLSAGRRLSMIFVIGGAIALVVVVLQDATRLQRFMTLSDTDMVSERISGSVNAGLFDLLENYPFGAGLARAFGTSIPYFLSQGALPQVGMESEWGRIVVEQGFVGFLGWVVFVAASLFRRARSRSEAFTASGARTVYVFVGTAWLVAFTGAGMLSAVPGAALLLFYMGVLLRGGVDETPVIVRLGQSSSGTPAPMPSAAE